MIEWRVDEGVCELALGLPPCNEIGTEMLARLEAFLAALDPKQVRAVVIHSTLRSGFCAGADLRELYAGLISRPAEAHEPEVRAYLDRIHRVMDRLDMLPLTTVGAIHGVCFGGGFELALTCDLLVADRSARFGFPELRLGLIPGFGGIPRLKRDVGNAVVRDLLLTGRTINAKKAATLGLVSQVVAPGEALGVARAMARQATRFHPDAADTAKAFIKHLPSEDLAREKEHFLRLFRSPVVAEALRRFVESKDLRPYLP